MPKKTKKHINSASPRQQKTARNFIEALKTGKIKTAGELLKISEYSESTQKKPNSVLNTKSFLKELAKYGFTEQNAKGVVAEILLDKRKKASDRLNASDKVFKVLGTYAPEQKETKAVVITWQMK